jgi:hypothetical protein
VRWTEIVHQRLVNIVFETPELIQLQRKFKQIYVMTWNGIAKPLACCSEIATGLTKTVQVTIWLHFGAVNEPL